MFEIVANPKFQGRNSKGFGAIVGDQDKGNGAIPLTYLLCHLQAIPATIKRSNDNKMNDAALNDPKGFCFIGRFETIIFLLKQKPFQLLPQRIIPFHD
jgi:hypothetical protein